MFVKNKLGLLEMIVAMIIMGTVGYFVVESNQKPHNVVFFRCLFGMFFLAIYCYFAGFFRNTGLTKKSTLMIVVSGIFLFSNWILLFASFQLSSISTATTIYHTQPFFFILIGSFILKEKIAFDKIIIAIFAFFGVLLVSEFDWSFSSFSNTKGLIFSILAAVLWAASASIVKNYVKDIKPHLIAFLQMLVGVAVLFLFADMSVIPSITKLQWSHLAILGAVHTGIVYILMYSSYSKLSTSVIAVLTFIYPAVAIVVDIVAYDISISLYQGIGMLIVLVSSYAVNQNFNFNILRNYKM